MIPIDLKGKIALVAGVGDDRGFAWHISKALAAAGARMVFATHPRLCNVVTNILERDLDKDSRQLLYGAGELKVALTIAVDAASGKARQAVEAAGGTVETKAPRAKA